MLLSELETESFIGYLQAENFELEYSFADHKLAVLQGDGTLFCKARLPLQFQFIPELIIDFEEPKVFLVALLQSGSAALGFVEENLLLHHKVIKTYMVRKKQGKSQVKHLNSKGKSKAGSRIRLANTVQFFEDINERLEVFNSIEYPERIATFIPKNLSNLLYNANTPCPFEKEDPRVYPIPWHIPTPSFEVLQKTVKTLLQCAIEIDPKKIPQLEQGMSQH